jgi:hypothetical protein
MSPLITNGFVVIHDPLSDTFKVYRPASSKCLFKSLTQTEAVEWCQRQRGPAFVKGKYIGNRQKGNGRFHKEINGKKSVHLINRKTQKAEEWEPTK